MTSSLLSRLQKIAIKGHMTAHEDPLAIDSLVRGENTIIMWDELIAAITEANQLRALHESRPDTYSCAKCGRRDGLDCVIPNQLWNQIEAETGHGVLCAWCLDDELAARGIQTRGLLAFAGRAISGGTTPFENNDAHWEIHLEHQNAEYHRMAEKVDQLRAVLRELMDHVYWKTNGKMCIEQDETTITRARALLGEEKPE